MHLHALAIITGLLENEVALVFNVGANLHFSAMGSGGKLLVEWC